MKGQTMATKRWAQRTITLMLDRIMGQTQLRDDKKSKPDQIRFGQFLRQLIECIPESQLDLPCQAPILFEDNFDDPLQAMLQLDATYRLSKQVEKLGQWAGYKPAKIWSLIAEQKWEEPKPAEARHLLLQFTTKQEQISALVNYFNQTSGKKIQANPPPLLGQQNDDSWSARPSTKQTRAAAIARLRQNPIRPHGGYTAASTNGSAPSQKPTRPKLNNKVFRASVYIGQSEIEEMIETVTGQAHRSSWSDTSTD